MHRVRRARARPHDLRAICPLPQPLGRPLPWPLGPFSRPHGLRVVHLLLYGLRVVHLLLYGLWVTHPLPATLPLRASLAHPEFASPLPPNPSHPLHSRVRHPLRQPRVPQPVPRHALLCGRHHVDARRADPRAVHRGTCVRGGHDPGTWRAHHLRRPRWRRIAAHMAQHLSVRGRLARWQRGRVRYRRPVGEREWRRYSPRRFPGGVSELRLWRGRHLAEWQPHSGADRAVGIEPRSRAERTHAHGPRGYGSAAGHSHGDRTAEPLAAGPEWEGARRSASRCAVLWRWHDRPHGAGIPAE